FVIIWFRQYDRVAACVAIHSYKHGRKLAFNRAALNRPKDQAPRRANAQAGQSRTRNPAIAGARIYYNKTSISSEREGSVGFQTISLAENTLTNARNRLSCFFHLVEVQFHRCRSSEDRHHHAQGRAVVVDFVHLAREVFEGSVRDFHRLTPLELQLGLGMLRRDF